MVAQFTAFDGVIIAATMSSCAAKRSSLTLHWLQVGLVSQRTRVYNTTLDVQRGVLVGFTYKKVNFTTNIFNFGWTTPTDVLSLGFNF